MAVGPSPQIERHDEPLRAVPALVSGTIALRVQWREIADRKSQMRMPRRKQPTIEHEN